MTLWPFLFETVRIVCYFLLGILVFGMRLHDVNWVGCFLTMGLTLPIFLMLGVISSSILIVVKRGDPINWFFTGVSGILAGTMFPISVLPPWLQIAAQCLPLTHSLEALRRCLLVGASAPRLRPSGGALSVRRGSAAGHPSRDRVLHGQGKENGSILNILR